jgi:regulatory protein
VSGFAAKQVCKVARHDILPRAKLSLLLRMSGKITALKIQRGAKDRVNVYLDGEFAFGLALIHALWLKTGQSLTDQEIETLKDADTLEKAKQRAIGLIDYRPRSVREVRLRLKRAGVDDEKIETVVESLKSAGLLDDSEFSKIWVESRLRSKPKGKRLIAWELRQKGVSEHQIGAALENVDDQDAAYRAALKRLPRLKSLPAHERRRKLSDHLARNGFGFDVIEDILRRVESLDDSDPTG